MRWSGAILGVLLLSTVSSRGDARPLDRVKVTERAQWQARDSSSEVWSLEVPKDWLTD